MDRVIRLFKPEVTRGEYGAKEEILSWNGDPNGLEIRAELMPVQRKMEEKQDGGKETAFSEKHWRIRYREGIDENVMIRWRGNEYDVIGIIENDRDQYLVLKSEKSSLYENLNYSSSTAAFTTGFTTGFNT